jgi:hypothetical protein
VVSLDEGDFEVAELRLQIAKLVASARVGASDIVVGTSDLARRTTHGERDRHSEQTETAHVATVATRTSALHQPWLPG